MARPDTQLLSSTGDSSGPDTDAPLLTRRELAWAGLLLSLCITLFLSPALLTGRYLSPFDLLFGFEPWHTVKPADWSNPSNPLLSDSPLLFEPWLAYSSQRLHTGTLPLWNTDSLLGVPFIGNMESAVFYPGNWLYFLWPGGQTLVIHDWLKLLIAALGMYVLARDVLHVRPLSAGLAALTFALGPFMTLWLLYTLADVIAWLPWLYWSTARLAARPNRRQVALLALFAALSVLAGQPEGTYQVALIVAPFAVLVAWQTRIQGWGHVVRVLGLWVGGYALGALVAGIQMFPFAEYLTQSAALHFREAIPYTTLPMPYQYLWTILSPDLFGNPARGTWWNPATVYGESSFYCGVIPLLLAPLALFVRQRAQRRLMWFLLGISALTLAIIYHWNPIYQIVALLPLMRVAPIQRLVFALQFTLALLAALGVEGLVQMLPRFRGRIALVLALTTLTLFIGGIGVPWLFAHSYFQLPTNSPTASAVWQASLVRAALVLAGATLLLALLIGVTPARPRLSRAGFALLPILLIIDLCQARSDYNPTIRPQDYFPPTALTTFLRSQQASGLFRISAVGGLLLPNTNLVYGLADLRGYDGVEPQLYRDLATQIDPAIQNQAGGALITFNQASLPLFSLLNVRYVLTPPDYDPNYMTQVYPITQGGKTVGEIRGTNHPGQTFVGQRDDLTEIQVLGATYGHKPTGHLIFHLKTDPAAPVDLVRQEIDATHLPDDSYWSFRFPPIHEARGQKFYFYFESPDAQPNHELTLWYQQGDVYPQGTRMDNSQPAPGDLAFHTFSTGEPTGSPFVRVMNGGKQSASVYENRDVLPRAWLAHQVEVISKTQAALRRISDPTFDRRQTALLTAPLVGAQALPPTPPPESSDTVAITHYAPETVEIQTASSMAGVLILADQAFPGWEARVDGQSAPILTVDHALRGVYLPAGKHQVVFDYVPWSFRLGAVCSGGALLVLSALIWWPRRPPVQRERESDHA